LYMTQGINLNKSKAEQVVLGIIDLPSVLLVHVTYCPRLRSTRFILLTVGAIPRAVRYKIVPVTSGNPMVPSVAIVLLAVVNTQKGNESSIIVFSPSCLFVRPVSLPVQVLSCRFYTNAGRDAIS